MFDVDSNLIASDNHSSCCIFNDISDSITPLIRKREGSQRTTTSSLEIGTLKWKIDDDKVKTHAIIIKNAPHVPNVSQRLFCPQQWIYKINDNHPMRCGTYLMQYDDVLKLNCGRHIYAKTIPWNTKSNTTFIRITPNYKKVQKFYQEFNQKISNNQISLERAHICNTVMTYTAVGSAKYSQ